MAGAEPAKAPASAALKAVKDFLAGSLAGFACKIVEYPLDTVKVLQQTAPADKTPSAITIFRGVFQAHGFVGLYRVRGGPRLPSILSIDVL